MAINIRGVWKQDLVSEPRRRLSFCFLALERNERISAATVRVGLSPWKHSDTRNSPSRNSISGAVVDSWARLAIVTVTRGWGSSKSFAKSFPMPELPWLCVGLCSWVYFLMSFNLFRLRIMDAKPRVFSVSVLTIFVILSLILNPLISLNFATRYSFCPVLRSLIHNLANFYQNHHFN